MALAPTSRPPSLEPAKRMKIQATRFTTRVPRRSSHSWNMRVTSGRDASGISSGMEWNMRGKTRWVARVNGSVETKERRTWGKVVSAMGANVLCFLVQLLLPGLELTLSAIQLLEPVGVGLGGKVGAGRGRIGGVVEGVGVERMGGCKRVFCEGVWKGGEGEGEL